MLINCPPLNLSGKASPVGMLALGAVDSPREPFQSIASAQSEKSFGETASSKDPFVTEVSSKASKDASMGFADFSSVSVVQFYLCLVQCCRLLQPPISR